VAGDRILRELSMSTDAFDLRFGRKRDVHGHLVAVEVRIERGADERWMRMALPSTRTGSNA